MNSILRSAPALAVVALVAASGCDRPSGDTLRGRNAVLIVVDTLRADRTSLHGYARDTTPRLAALARRGVVFERARSQAACTFPSVNSLLTSRHPAHFLHQGYQRFGIPPEIPSIAEVLRARGFATAAVSTSTIVRATPSEHNRFGGFERGFDVFDEACLGRPAVCVNRRALALLETLEEPFFLYVHYLDPHAPYAPPRTHRRRFAGEFGGDPAIARGETGLVEGAVFKDRRPDLVSPDVVRHLSDLYDEEVAYLDARLGRLFDVLDRRGLLDDTVVVLASDHGEEFLEHGSFAHCRTLYDTETHVPLVVWPPGHGERGQRVATPVENLDVVPTLLDYLGVPPPAELQGRSLRPLVERRADEAPRVRRSLQANLRSIDDGRYKLIFELRTGDRQIFDLTRDPAETTDLATRPPSEAAVLDEQLAAWIRDNEEELATRRGLGYAHRVEQGLRALGYLQ